MTHITMKTLIKIYDLSFDPFKITYYVPILIRGRLHGQIANSLTNQCWYDIYDLFTYASW
jgi:hypothetical protein